MVSYYLNGNFHIKFSFKVNICVCCTQHVKALFLCQENMCLLCACLYFHLLIIYNKEYLGFRYSILIIACYLRLYIHYVLNNVLPCYFVKL